MCCANELDVRVRLSFQKPLQTPHTNRMAVKFKTFTGEQTFTILQSQPLEWVTVAIVIIVVIGGVNGEDLKSLVRVTV